MHVTCLSGRWYPPYAHDGHPPPLSGFVHQSIVPPPLAQNREGDDDDADGGDLHGDNDDGDGDGDEDDGDGNVVHQSIVSPKPRAGRGAGAYNPLIQLLHQLHQGSTNS